MLKHIVIACAFILFIQKAQAQKTIVGNVVSENFPVASAKVSISGTMLTTLTDFNGDFKISGIYATDSIELVVKSLWHKEYRKKIMVGSIPLITIELIAEQFLVNEIEILAIKANHFSAQSYVEMDKAAIRENNLGLDMPYVLNLTPSVVVTSDAGAGVGYTGIRIRGSDNSRVNVTINGMPLNDAESQGTFWVDLPDFASSADAIQIQRGVGTSTNGAGAFGASININTNQLKKKAFAEFHNSIGSFNTFRNTIAFGTGLINQKFTVDGRLSSIISDGYIDRASSDLKSFYTSAAYYGKKSSMRLNVFSGKEKTYQAWYGVYQDSLETNRTFNPYTYNNQTDNYVQTHYQFFWNTQFSKKFYTNVSLYHTAGKGYYEEYKEQEYFSSYGLSNVVVGVDTVIKTDLIRRRWLDNKLFGGNVSLNLELKKIKSILGGGYSLYFGDHFGQVIWAQYASNSSIDGNYYADNATKTDINVFSKNSFIVSKKFSTYLDLQLRNVNYSFNGLDEIFNVSKQKIAYSFFNPKLGLTFDMNNRNNFYASFGIGNREPNRADFVSATPQNYPKPESMQDVEAGYNFNGSKFSLAANVYYMNYKNQLVLTGKINDVGSYIRQNIPKSFRRGIELQTRFVPSKFIEWNANLTLSQNKTGKFSEYIDTYDTLGGFTQTEVTHQNTNIAFSPNLIAGSELKIYILNKEAVTTFSDVAGVLDVKGKRTIAQKLALSFISKYVGKQYFDNTSNEERSLEAYFTQDIRLRYELKSVSGNTFAFYLQAINVLNKLYSSNGYVYPYYYGSDLFNDKYYYPQAGINF
jgi:iron complex outermembrane receptor protein